MNHEARINDALRQLVEEYRLGMVQPDEYRTRRRYLIDAWGEKEVTTSPGSLRTADFPALSAKKAGTPLSMGAMVAIGIGIAAAMGGSAWFTFHPGKAAEEALPPPPAPLSDPVLAVRKAAEEFLANNAWEPDAIEGMRAKWRVLSAEDRAVAREQPAIRTLRYKVDQNVQAEALLVSPDAPPEDRQRLDLLTRFLEELDA